MYLREKMTKIIFSRFLRLVDISLKRQLLKMMPRRSICAEIGVWKGEFSRKILEIVKPDKLHLIDPWKYQVDFGKRLYGGSHAKNQQDMDAIYSDVSSLFKDNERVVIHRKLSHIAVDAFRDNYFDWIYIDGNHYYDFVKKDLELYYPKVKKNGFITGDDYLWTSPELNGDLPVKRAVDEFVNKYSQVKIKLMRSQFVIEKLL